MKIDYKDEIEYQNIDINQLRPNKSYDYLIENRNASLKDVLEDEEKLNEFLIERDCPCCRSGDYSFLYSKDNLKIVQCNECDIVYVNPVFDDDKYQEIYRSEDYQKIVKRLGEDSHLYRKQRFGAERVSVIDKFHDPKLPKTLFEVGCSTGFVIEEAIERGWTATGVELNPSAAAFAQERGLPVVSAPVEEFEADEPFSAVAMYDVLEHLINPMELLNNVVSMMQKGGALYIYVPNYNSASRQLLGNDNSHFIWPTHHLTYFTPDTLKGFLERAGLEVFHWETQGLDLNDWMWFLDEKTDHNTDLVKENLETLQFYINAAGHGKNLRMYARKV
ncbi:class I SAM-dependent methyltransferase [Pseudodesulfovibrio sp. zrk46]|uniref:class I SAM-dependent methyltransferase n=1 Tax=Pseudodesulfovibrio sp. zrk46 TaxID=2725288 RepID=UPI00144A1DDB|nr:class I SAM-dependent methyltransferase [Pseudodesulfovibrio sp. zrk46]QJB56583.1 class I SAM-dependent methyltransferase [Pseudodesulfovibrio sp. zrk46]